LYREELLSLPRQVTEFKAAYLASALQDNALQDHLASTDDVNRVAVLSWCARTLFVPVTPFPTKW
jgi:hypothetical protein